MTMDAHLYKRGNISPLRLWMKIKAYGRNLYAFFCGKMMGMFWMILEDMKQPAGYIPLGMMTGLVVICVLLIRRRQYRFETYVRWFLLGTYLTVVLMQAFFSREPGSRSAAADLILFDTWGTTMREHAYVIENVLMFIPFGVLIPLTEKGIRWWQCILLGMVFSMLIEGVQLWTGRGFCQLDDVVMNTLGTAIGVLFALPFRKNVHHAYAG